MGSLLIAAACVLLGACGGGQQHATTGAARTEQLVRLVSPGSVRHVGRATAAAAGDATATAPSRAQALAFVRAVNLSVADIPEASVEKNHSGAATASERRGSQACERRAGWPEPHTIARASSPKLKRGQELEIERITSSVWVLGSEQAVARQFALLSSPPLRECLARVLAHGLDDRRIREARWGHVSISRLPVNAPGTSATVGLRVLATLELPFSEVTVPFYEDVLGFAIGQAQVVLAAASVTQPVPATTEQELLSLLLARAKAHPL